MKILNELWNSITEELLEPQFCQFIPLMVTFWQAANFSAPVPLQFTVEFPCPIILMFSKLLIETDELNTTSFDIVITVSLDRLYSASTGDWKVTFLKNVKI